MKKLVITIDGPAGSGKSTTARLVAKRLDYLYLDTGAMYRAVTLKAIQTGIDLEDIEGLEAMAAATEVDIVPDPGGYRVLLDGEDVTERIRSRDVTRASSIVSAVPGVRRRMVEIQRRLGQQGGIVAEGRDMGSVVFPDADLKIYLDADLETRARRRKLELEEKGEHVDIDDIRKDIIARDTYDSQRRHSPLVVPDGAVVIDTTHLTIQEQVELVLSHVKRIVGEKA